MRTTLALLFSLLAPPTSFAAQEQNSPNIMIIVADDLGVDALSLFSQSPNAAVTPNIDALAQRGVMFTEFWSQPTCTPSRTEMLTGRYGFRTGVLAPLGGSIEGDVPDAPPIPAGSPREESERLGLSFLLGTILSDPMGGPSPDEFSLPMALSAHPTTPYSTGAIGKWHLADVNNGWTDHPNLFGFDHYEGPFAGYPESYFAWNELKNGQWEQQSGYGPSSKVDDAVAWVADQGNHPWFLWLAFNTPHMPLHKPPVELINTPALKALDPQVSPLDQADQIYRAMVEALDTEIGRLFEEIPAEILENTIIAFIGDNGTDGLVIGDPFSDDHAKNTVYQGGIHVPAIFAGPGIAQGKKTAALAKTVDLFSTVIAMTGAEVRDVVPDGTIIDSQNLLPLLQNPDGTSIRAYNYVDLVNYTIITNPNRSAIRDSRFKLVQIGNTDALYDLAEDPNEQINLLAARALSIEATAALEALRAERTALSAE